MAGEAPNIRTTLEFGRDISSTPPAGSELAKARARNKELADAQRSAETPQDRLRLAATKRHTEPFLTGRGEAGKAMFGAGSTEIGTDGKAKSTSADNSDEKFQFNEGARLIDRYTHQLSYTLALTEMQARGITTTNALDAGVETALLARGIKITATDYASWRTETIADVRGMLPPEAYADIPPGEIDQWIEDTITSHDQYRTTVMSRLKQELDQLSTLPKLETDPDYEAAKTTRTTAEIQRNTSVNAALDTLERALSSTIPPDIKDRVAELIKEGKSTEAVINYLRTSMLAESRMPNVNKFIQYTTDLASVETLEAKIKAYKGSPTISKSYEDELEIVRERINKTKADLIDPTIQKEFTDYKQIVSLVSTAKDQGFYVSSLAQELNDGTNYQKELQKAETTITTKEAAGAGKDHAWRAERLQAEAAALNRIDGITENAISAVLEAQIGARDRAQKTITAKEIEDAEKAGNTRLATALKKLQQEQDAHGVRRDEGTRKVIVNYEQLGDDVRWASYHGENAAQRLILRDLTAGATGDKIMIKDPTTGVDRPINWRTDDLSLLSEADTKHLQAVVTQRGDKYMERLLGDFYIARGMGGRNGIDGNPFTNARHLKLRDHELAAIAEHFGPALEAKANSSEDMKKAIDEAKKKGAKGKGLLMIILGLLIGAGYTAKEAISFK